MSIRNRLKGRRQGNKPPTVAQLPVPAVEPPRGKTDGEPGVKSGEPRVIVNEEVVWELEFGTTVSPTRAGHANKEDTGIFLSDEFDDPNVEHADHIMFLGRAPSGQKGGLRAVGRSDKEEDDSELYRLLEADTLPALHKSSLPLENGPYADKDGVIAEAARETKGKTLRETIERTIDLFSFDLTQVDTEMSLEFPKIYLSPHYRFIFSRGFDTLPDVASTAGNILGSKEREQDGFFVLTHPLEPYLLAAATLIRNGISAYPAFGVQVKEGKQVGFPLIAIIDLTKTVPLMTFPLMRGPHPPMTSIGLLSDTAMQGMTHALWAETRVKHLTKEMIDRAAGARPPLSEPETVNQLNRIAEQLFECYKRWPRSHLINEALAFAEDHLIRAHMTVRVLGMKNWLLAAHPNLRNLGPHLESDPIGTITTMLGTYYQDLAQTENPELWQRDAIVMGHNYTQQIQHQFNLLTAKAIAADQEKE